MRLTNDGPIGNVRISGAATEGIMMLGRKLTNIQLLAGFCALTFCGCTRNNQLMIRPVDGFLTYCRPLDPVPAQGWRNAPNERCIDALEALGFTKAENIGLAGGGGIYLTDDGHVLGSEELTALSPYPPQNHLFPSKGSGLMPGDAIIAVNGVMTKTRSEIVPHLIGKPDQHVTVRIRRKNIEQDVTMSFKPWLECDGNIFYDEKFFFHFEYADKMVPGRR
jgi:PDZ domain